MSDSKSDSDASTNGPTHQSLDEFTMLTMLLRLTSALTNYKRDISLHELGYTAEESTRSFFESIASESILSLDTINAMLVRDRRNVISACYVTSSRVSVIVLEDGDDADLVDPNSSAIGHNSPVIPGAIARLKVPSKGKSFWSEIKEQSDDWYCAKLDSISLQDHVATVFDYLNDYKDSSNWIKNGDRFINYLLAACWRKMYQGISSWSGLGFVYSLKSLWNLFEIRIKQYNFSKDSELAHRSLIDQGLADYMVNNPVIMDALEQAFPPETPFLSEHQGFQALMMTAKSTEGPLYTKETAPQFHRLLLAALILFGFSLNDMFEKNLNESDVEILEGKKSRFALVKNVTKLLYFILRSSAFNHHIRIITRGGYEMDLLTHHNKEEDIYLNFAYDHKIRRRPDNSDNKVSYDSPNDDPGVATLRALALVQRNLRIDAFVKWARTLVIHIIGKPALEFRSNNIPNNAKLQASVLAVDPALSYANPSWSEFQCVIERALMDESNEEYDPDSDSPKTDDIVKAIIRKINDEAMEWKGEAAKTIDYFKSLLQESEQCTTQGDAQLFPFHVGMHCEAVFAAVVESYRGIGPNRNSLEIDSEGDMALHAISVEPQAAMISISRPCCPVCWILLKIMGAEKSFAPRGCHSVIHPVVLPPSLPQDIRDIMVMRFRGCLRTRINQLIRW
ncbi:hypothetical protein F5887DRAFT_1009523 [Amanita rubescens]|nr:hypothetical protein F5887DRAFT_1009523 [Amanita rubescens]